MWDTRNNSLCIDVRSSVEVLLLGSLEMADAHIPYADVDMDEWCEYMKAYRSQSNNAFLLCVDELLIERGLNRSCALSLVASSYRQGVMAANILSVAGYGNVAVTFGRKSDSVFGPAGIGNNRDFKQGRQTNNISTRSFDRQMGERLH
ncbi:hypothetical protein [Candidatus Thiodiazotropha sp. CDECU1]|uniref:hypothetical protein n=1 Tax=Candidatus Thiodiazotropha sp. CDECU1 TaxID=3065865 RepID=UPI00292E9EAA|nr:hypothetical protein [Candidatus Thiodiazotropha sp. CDECU1]